MPRPAVADASAFYHGYINNATGNSVKEVIANHSKEILDFYNSLPEQKAIYAYAEGKWTIKQLLLHVIDAERIFTYRALRIARKDTTPLAGFDENTYADNDGNENRTFQSLKDEFNAVRKATDLLYSNFSETQLNETGTASNKSITVNALCFIAYGHLLHHKKILEERYL
ncbi:MAG: DinB family protein [Panacibacter sp.]